MFLKTMIYQNPLVQLLFMSLFILFDEAEIMEKNVNILQQLIAPNDWSLISFITL